MTLRGFTGAYYVGLTGLLWVSMGASHTTQAGDHVVCYQNTDPKHACNWVRDLEASVVQFTAICRDPRCQCIPAYRCVQNGHPKRIYLCQNKTGDLCDGVADGSPVANKLLRLARRKELHSAPGRYRREAGQKPMPVADGIMDRIMGRHRRYNQRSFDHGPFFLRGFSRKNEAFIRKRMSLHAFPFQANNPGRGKVNVIATIRSKPKPTNTTDMDSPTTALTSTSRVHRDTTQSTANERAPTSPTSSASPPKADDNGGT